MTTNAELMGLIVQTNDSVNALHRGLGSVEGKIDTFIKQMGTQDTRTTDLEVRTRKVENRQHWYSGVAAAVGALIGLGAGHGVTGH